MADKTIKGITIEIGGETRPLQKAFDDVNKKTRDLQAELKSVDRLLKLDPENTELLAQKQKLLAEQVENSKEKLDRLRAAQEKVEAAFKKGEIGEEQYRHFSRQVINAEQDLKKFENQLKSTSEETEKFEDRISKSHEKLKTTGTVITTAGVAVTAGLGGAVKVAADFEQELSNAKAVSGATADDMAKLKAAALDMGASTSFSASEVAKGMTELLKGGMTVDQVLSGGLKSALDLAAAGELEMGQAAEYVVKTMGPFNIQAEDAGRVANTLAGAANASATDVEEMGQGMSQVAAVAAQMGVSMEDTATALGLFANKGIVGSDAGTALKTTLMRLVPSTKEATEEFKRLGIITKEGNNRFFDSEGNLKNLSEVSGILKESLGGLTAEQQQMAMSTMFGSDAIRAAAILTDSGAEGFNRMAEAVGKVKASDVAAEKLNNLNGSLENLKGGLETAAISIGDALMPMIRKISEIVSSLVTKFNALPEGTKQIIATIGALTAGLALITGPLLLIIGFIPQITAGLGTLAGLFGGAGAAATGTGTALAGLLGPITAVIAVIALVVAAIKDLWTNNEEFRNSVIEIWDEIKQSIKEAIEQITAWWKKWGPAIMKVITPVWEAIKTVVATAVKVIGRIISLFLNILTGDWKGAWEDLKGIVKAVWDGIKGLLQAGINFVKAIWNLLIQVVKEKLAGIINYFKSIPDQITGFFTNLPQKIGYQIGLLLGTLAKFGLDAVNWARTEVPKIIQGIADFFKELPGKILAWLIQALNSVAAWGKDLLAWAQTELPGVIAGIGKFFSELPEKLLDIGKRMVEGLWNGIQAKVAWLSEQITGFVKGVIAGFTVPLEVKSPSRVFMAIGRNIVEGLGNGIRDNGGYALDEIKRLGDQILNTGNAISTGILRTDEKTGQVIYDKTYDTVMKKIDLYYKERDQRVAFMTDGTDDNIKQIEREIEATQKATDIKLKLYEQEYQAKYRLIDDASDARVKALQKEIDAIDELNEQEERAKEEQEYQDKMSGLYAQYEDAAGSGNEEAAQDLLAEIRQAEAEHQEKLIQQERRDRQEQLREQIELAREEAAQKKAALEEELEEKRYNLEQQRVAEIEHMNKIVTLMQEQVKLKEELEKTQTDIKDREQKLQTESQSEEARKQTENELTELKQREKDLKESIGNNQATLENWTPQLQLISNRYGQVLLSGFKSTEGQIKAYMDSLVEYLRNRLMEMSAMTSAAAGGADGSHAAGLAYVPYDNYRAILHEGERVLTKAENREYQEGTGRRGGDVNVTQHIYSPKANPREEQRRAARAFKKLALGV